MKKVEKKTVDSSWTDTQLVELWAELTKEKKAVDEKISAVKAELQTRALAIFDDHNTKFTQYFGSDAVVSVMNSQKLSILSDRSLQRVFGDTIESQVSKESKTVYTYSKPLETAIKAIVGDDYNLDTTLEQFLAEQFSDRLDSKSLKQLQKKLTGDYAKDSKLLIAKLGVGHYEEELFFIHQIKNGELIKAFLPEDTEEKIKKVKRYAVVEESLSAGIAVQ